MCAYSINLEKEINSCNKLGITHEDYLSIKNRLNAALQSLYQYDREKWTPNIFNSFNAETPLELKDFCLILLPLSDEEKECILDSSLESWFISLCKLLEEHIQIYKEQRNESKLTELYFDPNVIDYIKGKIIRSIALLQILHPTVYPATLLSVFDSADLEQIWSDLIAHFDAPEEIKKKDHPLKRLKYFGEYLERTVFDDFLLARLETIFTSEVNQWKPFLAFAQFAQTSGVKERADYFKFVEKINNDLINEATKDEAESLILTAIRNKEIKEKTNYAAETYKAKAIEFAQHKVRAVVDEAIKDLLAIAYPYVMSSISEDSAKQNRAIRKIWGDTIKSLIEKKENELKEMQKLQRGLFKGEKIFDREEFWNEIQTLVKKWSTDNPPSQKEFVNNLTTLKFVTDKANVFKKRLDKCYQEQVCPKFDRWPDLFLKLRQIEKK